MKNFICLFGIIQALLSTALSAQEAMANTDVPLIEAKLTGIAIDGKVSGLYLFSQGAYEAVDFYVGVRSKSIRYLGPRELKLYRKETTEEGEAIWKAVASTQLRGDASDYLLFVSKQSASGPVQIFALPEDLAEFSFGSFRFVNLTEKSIALKLGETKALIKPNNFTDVKGDFDHGNSYQTLMLELPPDGGSAKPLLSSQLYFNERMRMLYLISSGADSSQIRLTGIPQKKR